MDGETEMAGDWIKMRTALANDPAVIAIALDLDKSEFEIVGMLHHLWSWADSQSQDGHIKRVTEKWIDRYVHQSGFAKSMSDAGWLILENDGITFPNFDRHNGESAKKRAEAAERQRISRANKALSDVTDSSQKTCDKSVTREEKEKNKDQDQKLLLERFDSFWKLYPNKVAKPKALASFSKQCKGEESFLRIMHGLSQHILSEQFVKDDGKFIPHPTTWLNQERYNDEVKPYVAGKSNSGANREGSISLVEKVRRANAHLFDEPPVEADARGWPEFDSIREIDGHVVAADD